MQAQINEDISHVNNGTTAQPQRVMMDHLTWTTCKLAEALNIDWNKVIPRHIQVMHKNVFTHWDTNEHYKLMDHKKVLIEPGEEKILGYVINGSWRNLGYKRIKEALEKEMYLDYTKAIYWTAFAIVLGCDSLENYPDITKQKGIA